MGYGNIRASNYMILSIIFILCCFIIPIALLYKMNNEDPR
jgi:hypothetical protein